LSARAKEKCHLFERQKKRVPNYQSTVFDGSAASLRSEARAGKRESLAPGTGLFRGLVKGKKLEEGPRVITEGEGESGL